MKVALVLAAVLSTAGAFMFAAPRESLNQNATYMCVKNGDFCSLIFTLVTTDSIALVYLEDPNDPTNHTAGTFDSDGNGITGDGSATNPYTVDVTVNCATATQTLQSPAGVPHVITDPDMIEIAVIAKSIYAGPFYATVQFANDTRYKPACNFSAPPIGEAIGGPFLIAGAIDEGATEVAETATLVMVRPELHPTNMAFAAALGENIRFKLELNPGSSFAGGYLFDCTVCGTENCSPGVQIIDSNGCSTIPTYMTTGFVRDPGTDLIMTSTFPAYMVDNSPLLYLRCSVGYCVDAADPKCDDYCAYTSGRKKRQAQETKTETVETVFRIIINGDVNPSDQDFTQRQVQSPAEYEIQSQSNIGLLAAVITLSGVLLVALIVALVVFLRLSKRNANHGGKA